MSDSTRGFTVYVCFGRYAGFGIKRDMGLRIILGWMAIALLTVDIEQVVAIAAKHLPSVAPDDICQGCGEVQADWQTKDGALLCNWCHERPIPQRPPV